MVLNIFELRVNRTITRFSRVFRTERGSNNDEYFSELILPV